jgi:aspartyl-tRNA(Asn)/glutamyl-tRNA(Gln) amidotransferase subunit C
MKIDDKLIEYIGDLSRLYLSDEEKAERAKDLTDILGYVEKLSELDTAGLPEMTHPFEQVNRFRTDEVTNAARTDEMLAGAPERSGDYFKVKRTVEE